MSSNDNFCNWTDANAFMRGCFVSAGMDVPAQRELIVIAQRLESPLELVMLSAIKAAERVLKYQDEKVAKLLREFEAERMFSYELQAAVPIGTYRADLVMRADFKGNLLQSDGAPPAVVIECDGFTFHDKTRDQAIRDRARDRYMQREGFIVARFAGDEIIEQPFACAFEVYDLVIRGGLLVDRSVHPVGGWPVFTRGRADTANGPPSLRLFDITCDTSQEQKSDDDAGGDHGR